MKGGKGGRRYRQPEKTRGQTRGNYADLTRRWALRESLPPTEVTLQVYVPMSPDHVWEMCRVPSGSNRKRGELFTSIAEPLFSHKCLKETQRTEGTMGPKASGQKLSFGQMSQSKNKRDKLHLRRLQGSHKFWSLGLPYVLRCVMIYLIFVFKPLMLFEMKANSMAEINLNWNLLKIIKVLQQILVSLLLLFFPLPKTDRTSKRNSIWSWDEAKKPFVIWCERNPPEFYKKVHLQQEHPLRTCLDLNAAHVQLCF